MAVVGKLVGLKQPIKWKDGKRRKFRNAVGIGGGGEGKTERDNYMRLSPK